MSAVTGKGDCYWEAALLVLADPWFARDPRVWRHVDPDDGIIDWPAILGEGGWSSGERQLLTAAASLWGGDQQVSLAELASLGDRALELLLQAWAVLRQGLRGSAVPLGGPR